MGEGYCWQKLQPEQRFRTWRKQSFLKTPSSFMRLESSLRLEQGRVRRVVIRAMDFGLDFTLMRGKREP